tara:strand:+ start:25 stop:345 length:321 start_codon:yes stop_codon:yes gene_type:complete
MFEGQEITVKQDRGRSLATGEWKPRSQYRIELDGVWVAYLPFDKGAKIIYLAGLALSPLTVEAIDKEVREVVGDKELKSIVAPEIPEELLNPDSEDEPDDADDFDS